MPAPDADHRHDAVDASIILVIKNEARYIGEVLDAIYRQDYAGRFEVVAVDSGSTDGTLEILSRYPVRLYQIPPAEFHHGRTRNLGARLALGRYLVYLGGDATPADKRWLRVLLDELEAPDVAGSYGRQLPREWAWPMERFFLSFLYGPERRVQRASGGVVDVDATLFSNVTSALKRELWERWPWTEQIVMSEDQVWARQAVQAGYSIVYNPAASVWHTHNYPINRAFKRFFDSGLSSLDSFLPSDRWAMLRFAGRSARYLALELAYLVRHGYVTWIPYALVYEGAKFSGLLLGRLAPHLPRRLARRLSWNPW